MEKTLIINYHVFSSPAEMEKADAELLEAAKNAAKGSYSPYSNFRVGAAVRLDGGHIVCGANQENAAFPSGICAERTAMYAAGAAHPGTAQRSIAIAAYGSDGRITEAPASPCGACRQVMAEYQKLAGEPISVIVASRNAIYKFDRVDDVLPFIFDCI